VDLPGVALGRADAAGQVATVPIGTVELLAQHSVGAEREQHAAQRVGQVERGAGTVEGADQMAGQAVIVQLTGERAGAGIVVFLQAEEVDGEGGAASAEGAFEDAAAAGMSDLASAGSS